MQQDDYSALLGRIGLRAGLKFHEHRGSVYARLSSIYDFDGDSSAAYSKGGQVEHQQKTSGGEVKENWRWNIGLRHVW